MTRHATEPERPAWDTIVLACRACSKRRRGPDDLPARLAVREARAALRGPKPRPRVVASGCLGLCPDHAIAVAVVGAGRAPAIVAVTRAEGVGDAVRALLETAPGGPPLR